MSAPVNRSNVRPWVFAVAVSTIVVTSWAATIWQQAPSAWTTLPGLRYQVLPPWGVYTGTAPLLKDYFRQLNVYRLNPRGHRAPTPPPAGPIVLAIGGMAVAVVLVRATGRRSTSTTSMAYGSARFATEEEVRQAGLLRTDLPCVTTRASS